MNEGFIENELVIITKQTFENLAAQLNNADLITLYLTYYSIAKWQKTNHIFSTTSFTANRLNWAEGRLRRAKKQLIDMGLIEDLQKKDSAGKIAGHYIKVNYIFCNDTLSEIHTVDNPQCGSTHSVDNRETSTLSNINISALSNNNKSALSNKRKVQRKFPDFMIEDYTEDQQLREAIKDFVEYRKVTKAPVTEKALKLCLGKLDKLGSNTAEKIAIVEQTIERGWKGLFPLKEKINDPDKQDPGYDAVNNCRTDF